MKVCKLFGPTLPHEKSEYDAEPNITKRVLYKQKTLVISYNYKMLSNRKKTDK